jgi:hypothetical protein
MPHTTKATKLHVCDITHQSHSHYTYVVRANVRGVDYLTDAREFSTRPDLAIDYGMCALRDQARRIIGEGC